MTTPKDNPSDEDEITQATPQERFLVEEQREAPQQALELKCKELEDRYLRTYADFENYRKRVAKEKEDVVFSTTERLLKELLEVKDHLELALSHSEPTQDAGAKVLHEGVELTLKQLIRFLEKLEVKEIEALNQNFNPAFHEAIQQEPSADHAPGVVVKVFQKGYLLKQRLLRPARVVVSS